MDARGRMSLPADIRKQLNMDEGGELVVQWDEEKVILTPKRQQIREHILHLQQYVREHVPKGVSLVDEFIAERRKEATQEEEKGL